MVNCLSWNDKTIFVLELILPFGATIFVNKVYSTIGLPKRFEENICYSLQRFSNAKQYHLTIRTSVLTYDRHSTWWVLRLSSFYHKFNDVWLNANSYNSFACADKKSVSLPGRIQDFALGRGVVYLSRDHKVFPMWNEYTPRYFQKVIVTWGHGDPYSPPP